MKGPTFPGDGGAARRITAQSFRGFRAWTLRDRWTDSERESEEARVAPEIARLIEAGTYTRCPPQTFTPTPRETFNADGVNGLTN